MKTLEDDIWQAFDLAIDEQYLSDGKLDFNDELAEKLSLFYRQAVAFDVQSLHLLATNDELHRVMWGTTKTIDSVTLKVLRHRALFSEEIVITPASIYVGVITKDDMTAWSKKVHFSQRSLAAAIEQYELSAYPDYDELLNALVAAVFTVRAELERQVSDAIAEVSK